MSENPFDPDAADLEVGELDGAAEETSGPDGIEGADDILEADRERDADELSDDAADYDLEIGEDESVAAEQGNREGDEMVSEGDDPAEVAELGGDDLDIDAIETETLGEGEEFRVQDDLEVGITGDVDTVEPGDDDPLAR